MVNPFVLAAYDVTSENRKGNLNANARVSFKVRANIDTRLSCGPLQLVCMRAQGVMTYEVRQCILASNRLLEPGQSRLLHGRFGWEKKTIL